MTANAAYAGLGRRLGAFAIDYVIASVPTMLVAVVLGPLLAGLGKSNLSASLTYRDVVLSVTWGVPLLLAAASALACSMPRGDQRLLPYVGVMALRFICFVAGVGVGVFLAALGAASVARRGRGDIDVALGWVVAAHVYWIYWAGMESSAARGTVGKILLGIAVVDLDGARISFLKAVGRCFGRLATCPLFFLVGMTEKKQGIHDLLAGTVVTWRSRRLGARRPVEPPSPTEPVSLKLTWAIPLTVGVLILVREVVAPWLGTDLERSTPRAMFGGFLVSLALAVRRGELAAAWLLLAGAAYLLVFNAFVLSYQGIAISSVLVGAFTWGVIDLRRRGAPFALTPQWAQCLYELAFITGASILIAGLTPFRPIRLGVAAVYVGLGFAAFCGVVSAGYVLVVVTLYDLWNAVAAGDLLDMALHLGFLVIYALGTFQLRRLRHESTTSASPGLRFMVRKLSGRRK